jgi:hypothetical protein
LRYFRHRFLDVFYQFPIDRTALEKEMDRLVYHLLEEKADFFSIATFNPATSWCETASPFSSITNPAAAVPAI